MGTLLTSVKWYGPALRRCTGFEPSRPLIAAAESMICSTRRSSAAWSSSRWSSAPSRVSVMIVRGACSSTYGTSGEASSIRWYAASVVLPRVNTGMAAEPERKATAARSPAPARVR